MRRPTFSLHGAHSCMSCIFTCLEYLRLFLFASLLWSSIGLGYFIYGRRQGKTIPLMCGVVLMVYPYFMPNTAVLVVIGAIFTAVPYFLRR